MSDRIAVPNGPHTPDDPRFTMGLVIDVFDVLDRHGYQRGDNRALGSAVGALAQLVADYEGAGPEIPLGGPAPQGGEPETVRAAYDKRLGGGER